MAREGASRMVGVYIPPHLKKQDSDNFERLSWDALRRSINGLVNKVNRTNLKHIVNELLEENLVRGRGLFCRSVMKSQMASPVFSDVFAALVAVVNTKFPLIGDLLLRRVVLQLSRPYDRNDKPQLLAIVRFLAHLVNQQVADVTVALELLLKLLIEPTSDTVEVAVAFVTECGYTLQEVSPRGLDVVFNSFRDILQEGVLDYRSLCLIESLFSLRRCNFHGHVAILLLDSEDQVTHVISLLDEIDPESSLDVFKNDPEFHQNERKYEEIKKKILGDKDEDEEEEEGGEAMEIQDDTETDLVNLRRTIYLTIMSSLNFEEAGHKLLQIRLEPGQEIEICTMLLSCCTEERTYRPFYGYLAQRFCLLSKTYRDGFEKLFVEQYSTVHRLKTDALCNVAKFFASLMASDALPWHVLAYVWLTEEDTTSSSRIFIKALFLELSEHLGIQMLNKRLQDPTMEEAFESIFPKDNVKNTMLSINFFTRIGLGGITENLRQYLKNVEQKP